MFELIDYARIEHFVPQWCNMQPTLTLPVEHADSFAEGSKGRELINELK